MPTTKERPAKASVQTGSPVLLEEIKKIVSTEISIEIMICGM